MSSRRSYEPGSRLAVVLVGLLFLAISAAAGMCLAASPHAIAAVSDCPPRQPAPTCLRGKVLMWDPKGDPNAAELLIEDGYGAPMMWVDMFGVYSGGEPVCVTGLQFQLLACLGGPWSQKGASPVVTLYDRGQAVSLTVRDIKWIHAEERALIK